MSDSFRPRLSISQPMPPVVVILEDVPPEEPEPTPEKLLGPVPLRRQVSQRPLFSAAC